MGNYKQSVQNPNNAFIAACAHGHLHIVEELLESFPDIDMTAQDNQAIISACEGNHTRVAEFLCEDLNVDIYARGCQPFIDAVDNQRDEIIELLCDASEGSDILYLCKELGYYIKSTEPLELYRECPFIENENDNTITYTVKKN